MNIQDGKADTRTVSQDKTEYAFLSFLHMPTITITASIS